MAGTNMRGRAARAVGVAAAAAAATVLLGSPAFATVDDSFYASTAGGCAVLDFVDYGPGAAGGGNNDDYLVIHDYCADGYGVRAYAWLNGAYLGSKWNGNGAAGDAVVWDPFGNVQGGDTVGIKVCLANGSSGSPFDCIAVSRTSSDG